MFLLDTNRMTSDPNTISTSEIDKEQHIMMNGHSNHFNNSKNNSTDTSEMKDNDSNKVEKSEQSEMNSSSTLRKISSQLTSIVLNISSFIVLIILFVLFKKKFFAPFRRGFFCSDLSIRYPVGEDSVSTSSLVATCVVIGIIIFIIGEYILCKQLKCSNNTKHSEIKVKSWAEKWFVKATKYFLMYMWALLASQVIVNVLKHSIGTLRPNFFAVCNPNITCTSDDQLYHTDYSCQEISASKEAGLRTSFPSGHAAFSATSALFLVIYIQSKSRRPIRLALFGRIKAIDAFVVLLAPSLQLFCLILSSWTSLLRVSDYKHHLLDVIVGYVIGAVVGAITSYHALGWDKISVYQNQLSNDNTDGPPCSIQEKLELNEANGHQKNNIRKEVDIERVLEIEGGLNAANVNLTRQNTTMTTESELNDE